MPPITMPRLVRALVLLTISLASPSLWSATPPALSNPDATAETALGPRSYGALQGQASVSASGTASYILPLELPPGTHGMAPQLSLNFHSGIRNGLLGVGWFVQGTTSKIVRCSQTIAQDGQNKSLDLSSDDRFCLDGQRLLAVSGTYGGLGTEYRTESDEFSRITAHGGSTGNPGYFTVETKAGQTLTYGGSSDAKLEAPGSSVAVSWHRSKVEDAMGNYYTLSYDRPLTVTDPEDSYIHIERIDYTGNAGESLTPYASVQFEYATRDDVRYDYGLDGPIYSDQRLTHIKTYVGATMVSDYQMNYEYSASTGLSRLVALTQCGVGSVCKEAMAFDWSDDGASFSSADATSWAPLNIAVMGDFNGDGLPDALIDYGPSSSFTVMHKNPAGGIDNAQSGGVLSNISPSTYHVLSSDFNGDGRADLFAYPQQYSVSNKSYTFFADSDGKFLSVDQEISQGYLGLNWYGNATSGFDISSVDINGDGRSDLILRSSGTDYTLLADSNGQFTSLHQSGFPSGPYNKAFYKTITGDFNGDGKTDLLLQGKNDSGYPTVMLHSDDSAQYSNALPLSDTSSGVSGLQWSWDADGHLLLPGDYNGDGQTDVLMITRDTIDENYMVVANQDGLFASDSVIQEFAFWEFGYQQGLNWRDGAQKFHTGDFNGDGRTDVFLQIFQSGSNAIVLSDPDGRLAKIDQIWNASHLNLSWLAHDGIAFAISDYNGDGRADLLSPNNQYLTFLYSHPNQSFPDQLTTLTNGLGNTTSFTYKPLTDDTVYTKGTTATYPQQDVASSRYVVSEMTQSDGIGGVFTTEYSYEGLKRDLTGRGDLGFTKITTKNLDQNLTTVTEYAQGFPYSSLPIKVETRRTSDNLLLSSTETTYDSYEDQTVGSVYPFVSERVAKQYDLADGSLLSTTTTELVTDAYGNITGKTVLVEDAINTTSHETETLSTYNIDTTNWRVGQLTQQVVQTTLDSLHNSALDLTTSFSYDSTTGQLLSSTREPGGGAPLELTTTLTYDGFGNPLTQTHAPDTKS